VTAEDCSSAPFGRRKINYQPLSDRKQEIRVLRLLPSRDVDAPIKATLYHVNLEDVSCRSSRSYETLSYTWGKMTEHRTVTIDKVPGVLVTDNLFYALRRLRKRSRVRRIWIDALCINQQNNREKSAQVVLMAKIYESARFVNVWLGETPKPTTRLRYLPTKLWCWMGTSDQTGDMTFPREIEAMEGAFSQTMPHWTDRAWVVQEFLLSSKAYACFGSCRRQMGSFFLAALETWVRLHRDSQLRSLQWLHEY
jgi:hypothetical protein